MSDIARVWADLCLKGIGFVQFESLSQPEDSLLNA